MSDSAPCTLAARNEVGPKNNSLAIKIRMNEK